MIVRTVVGLVLCFVVVTWRRLVSLIHFFMWRILGTEERQCGQLLALCGLSIQTDFSAETRWSWMGRGVLHSHGASFISAHTHRFYLDLFSSKNYDNFFRGSSIFSLLKNVCASIVESVLKVRRGKPPLCCSKFSIGTIHH